MRSPVEGIAPGFMVPPWAGRWRPPPERGSRGGGKPDPWSIPAGAAPLPKFGRLRRARPCTVDALVVGCVPGVFACAGQSLGVRLAARRSTGRRLRPLVAARTVVRPGWVVGTLHPALRRELQDVARTKILVGEDVVVAAKAHL